MPYKNPEDQKAASRRHYEANKEAIINRVHVTRQSNTEFIRQAKDVPCVDCGVKYPYYVMQFDHVRGKKLFNIGDHTRINVSRKTLEAEIAKCSVRCSNCHAEVTHKRRQGEEV
jgi:hypothetical protein